MTNLILDNTYLILLLPLWIFLMIMGGRFFSVYVNKIIIYTLTILSSFFGILLCSAGLSKIVAPIEQSFTIIKISNFSIPFGIHIDKLSLLIALTLFIVSFTVQIFAIFYLKNEKKNYRFFAFLNMFNFSMAGLLFSPNMFQLYAFWELVGIMSYLLIGFEYDKNTKSVAAKRVFLINRIGDTALLAGIIICSYFMYEYAGNLSFSALSFEDFNAISTLIYAYTNPFIYVIICTLFLVAATVKSAQFPFHTWLQEAMEAKLPVSALLHSATMVVAGVYLIIRMVPFYILDNVLMNIILIIGLITSLICSLLASITVHPKKILAYSTSANLGLMFFAVGVGNIKAGLILLVSHALIKSMLFMLLPKKDEVSALQAFSFLIGSLTLSGFILTGFVSKELLYGSIDGNFKLLYCAVSFLGGFYLTRLYLLVTKDKKISGTNWGEYIPTFVLFVLTIIFYFYLRKTNEYQISTPFYSALLGWVMAYYLQTKNLLTKYNTQINPVEKIYYEFIPKVYKKFSNLCNIIDLKILGNYKLLIASAAFGIKLVNFIEIYILNKIVTLITSTCKQFSKWDLILQSGNVQVYNAYAFIIVTIILCIVIAGYTYILNMIS